MYAGIIYIQVKMFYFDDDVTGIQYYGGLYRAEIWSNINIYDIQMHAGNPAG